MQILRILLLGLFTHSISFSAFADDSLRQRLDAWSAGYDQIIFEAKINYPNQLSQFYEENNYQSLWLNQSKINDDGYQLLNAIKLISEEGLIPNDYHFNQLSVLTGLSKITADYDILLSDAYLILSDHLLNGKVNAASLTNEWIVKEKVIDYKALLNRIKSQEGVDVILDSLKPKNENYKRLKQALSKLKLRPQSDWEPLESIPVIKLNTTDSRIPMIRERLKFWGDYTSEDKEDDSEILDNNLTEGIKKFQIRHGLDADGVIGKLTFKALNLKSDDLIKKIIVNMERYRWQNNNQSGNKIVVNIAEFYLRFYLDNKLVLQKPVIVGKNHRKTPVFDDVLKYIVLNPTWTVPQKLMNEDKLPEIKKDPDYLKRMGFKLFQIGTNTEVDPQLIDWSVIKKKDFKYRMVQSPGELNALGQVKFMFPNPFDIYLHDTPTRDLFNKTDRAFSSGCIRVKDPIELAELILNRQSVESFEIDAILKSKQTKTIYLENPIPISIEYWTIWADESNNLTVREDIYDRDEVLYNALSKPITINRPINEVIL